MHTAIAGLATSHWRLRSQRSNERSFPTSLGTSTRELRARFSSVSCVIHEIVRGTVRSLLLFNRSARSSPNAPRSWWRRTVEEIGKREERSAEDERETEIVRERGASGSGSLLPPRCVTIDRRPSTVRHPGDHRLSP
eukprot:2439743-Rhodomonas_salina.1